MKAYRSGYASRAPLGAASINRLLVSHNLAEVPWRFGHLKPNSFRGLNRRTLGGTQYPGVHLPFSDHLCFGVSGWATKLWRFWMGHKTLGIAFDDERREGTRIQIAVG